MTDFQFPNPLSRCIFYNKYARFRDDLGRRETKDEAIKRAFDFLFNRYYEIHGANSDRDGYPDLDFMNVRQAMHRLDALPSMRVLWSAGPALKRNHIMAYNCSFMAVNRIEAFVEALYILMAGTGVGYSVEGEYVDALPRVKKQTRKTTSVHVIEDSTEGWAEALRAGLYAWWLNGEDVTFDASQVRPAGARLLTKGGRSSGPQPLLDALRTIRDLLLHPKQQGRNIKPLLAHDIMCLIAQVVVVGGIRRSSLISLSDLEDRDMRDAKSGEFWRSSPWRAMSNNSVAYNEKPGTLELLKEWQSLIKGQSGERGIFNREAFRVTAPRRKRYTDVGTNPCGEINLRDREFCNLSEIVCRPGDTRDSLADKIRAATIIGTIQSTLTDFPFISDAWRLNCEEERLLGVSATGQMDCPAFRDPDVQRHLKNVAIETNLEYSRLLGINPSVAITCAKPSGTASILVNSSSGQHTRWAKFYIRRVRLNEGDPMLSLYRAIGMVIHADPVTPATFVVDFPIKSPEGATTRHDLNALGQLDYWKSVKVNYTEHNPSATIYVKADEWIAVANWCYENWNLIGGLSFLPASDHVYPLAPFQEITEDEYNKLMETFPDVLSDKEFMDLLQTFEKEDMTTGAQEYACTSGACEII